MDHFYRGDPHVPCPDLDVATTTGATGPAPKADVFWYQDQLSLDVFWVFCSTLVFSVSVERVS